MPVRRVVHAPVGRRAMKLAMRHFEVLLDRAVEGRVTHGRRVVPDGGPDGVNELAVIDPQDVVDTRRGAEEVIAVGCEPHQHDAMGDHRSTDEGSAADPLLPVGTPDQSDRRDDARVRLQRRALLEDQAGGRVELECDLEPGLNQPERVDALGDPDRVVDVRALELDRGLLAHPVDGGLDCGLVVRGAVAPGAEPADVDVAIEPPLVAPRPADNDDAVVVGRRRVACVVVERATAAIAQQGMAPHVDGRSRARRCPRHAQAGDRRDDGGHAIGSGGRGDRGRDDVEHVDIFGAIGQRCAVSAIVDVGENCWGSTRGARDDSAASWWPGREGPPVACRNAGKRQREQHAVIDGDGRRVDS